MLSLLSLLFPALVIFCALKDVTCARAHYYYYCYYSYIYLRALLAAAADAIARRLAPLLMGASLSLDDEFESKSTRGAGEAATCAAAD